MSDTLYINHVSKRFGGVITSDNLSTTIDAGTCTAIIGPNGAGKSTLLNIVCGLIIPESGSITWRGEELIGKSFNEVGRRGIQRMFQDLRLFSSLTALENILSGLIGTRNGAPRLPVRRVKPDLARAFETLEQLGLLSAANRRIGELSYAEQKLVGLGRVLVSEPSLLVLDEPASGLDGTSLEIVVDSIKHAREQGCGVLIVEHNLEIVQRLATRGLLLEDGKIAADGPPAEVFESSDFGRVFFSLAESHQPTEA